MKIVIIGDGKVGHKLTTQLSEEDYDITLIDQNAWHQVALPEDN